jgi:hypothetical protein
LHYFEEGNSCDEVRGFLGGGGTVLIALSPLGSFDSSKTSLFIPKIVKNVNINI